MRSSGQPYGIAITVWKQVPFRSSEVFSDFPNLRKIATDTLSAWQMLFWSLCGHANLEF